MFWTALIGSIFVAAILSVIGVAFIQYSATDFQRPVSWDIWPSHWPPCCC